MVTSLNYSFGYRRILTLCFYIVEEKYTVTSIHTTMNCLCATEIITSENLP